MGVPTEGRGEADIVADLAPAFDRFVRSVGLPVSLAKDGLGAGDVSRLAAATMAPENKSMRDSNIREIKPADAARLAEAVLTAA
jgi:alcohol dehydrogenase class IV